MLYGHPQADRTASPLRTGVMNIKGRLKQGLLNS